ncbi:hypothetical protein EAF00_006862 [Botryotinia globosa]|nr:hypothetical protein EAF00_006862 [Botryotinia globosa]
MARALSATGATLFLTVRDIKKAETSLDGILEPDRVTLVEMDNASFFNIKTAAAAILEKSGNQLNILVNNAGVMAIKDLQLTEDGHEITFATNHLTWISIPACDNYNFQKGRYNYGTAYASSKLANIYMANEIDRRYGQQGLHATSLHPGPIDTNINRHLGREWAAQVMSNEKVRKVPKSAEQGAATTVIAAVGKEWEGKGGKYLENCGEAERGKDDYQIFGNGWVKQTYRPEDEGRLWRDSLKIVGFEDDMWE